MRANVDPRRWGRDGWSFLRNCAEACDEASFPHYQALVALLPEILPCEKCRGHARTYVAQHPVEDAGSLATWLERFEGAVAQRTREERAPAAPDLLAYAGLGALLAALALCCLAALRCSQHKGA